MGKDDSRPIGTATMTEDETISLNPRAEGPGPSLGDAQFVYPKGHEQYDQILKHAGNLKPGESKPIPPWTE